MEITQELVNRFFRQKCTPEENDFVGTYFDQHPGEMDKYLADEDWQQYEPEAQIHPAVSKKMLEVINTSIAKGVPKKQSHRKTLLIAASITLLVGIGGLLGISMLKNNAQETIYTASFHSNKTYNDTVSNKTNQTMAVGLPDGSRVLLSAKSAIYYHQPFTQKQRDIILKGEAVFKVAKDKTRPFTVRAGGLSTTALGTCFKVNALLPDKKISVKLYEGKVVIRHQYKTKHQDDVYLTPGLELNLDMESHVEKVAKFDNNTNPLSEPSESVPTISGSVIRFHNQQLSGVFKQLQQFYQISIKVDENQLTDKYFTGNADRRSESAEEVLRTIATLNRFSLKVQGKVYTLVPDVAKRTDSTSNAARNE